MDGFVLGGVLSAPWKLPFSPSLWASVCTLHSRQVIEHLSYLLGDVRRCCLRDLNGHVPVLPTD